MRRELERIDIPAEHEARERAWAVARAAFTEREPQPRPLPFLRPLLVAAALAALVAAAASPAGRAVVDTVRKAIGVAAPDEALFSLPAPGRLLVTADGGAWVVSADGSKRLLGDYDEAAWSPFGRFVVVSRRNELAALRPDGERRWKLARPDVRLPRWGGTRTDTRIAYLAGSRLHVVGGDGRGDVDAGGLPAAARVAPAWRPGPGFVLAYVDTRGRVTAYDAQAGSVPWQARGLRDARRIVWQPGTGRVVVVGRDRLVTVGAGVRRVEPLRGARELAFARDGRRAVVRHVNGRSDILVDGRVRFSGTGTLTGLAWSPDERWLVVAWSEADQLLFVTGDGPRRVRAAANLSREFESRSFPRLAGWCCR